MTSPHLTTTLALAELLRDMTPADRLRELRHLLDEAAPRPGDDLRMQAARAALVDDGSDETDHAPKRKTVEVFLDETLLRALLEHGTCADEHNAEVHLLHGAVHHARDLLARPESPVTDLELSVRGLEALLRDGEVAVDDVRLRLDDAAKGARAIEVTLIRNGIRHAGPASPRGDTRVSPTDAPGDLPRRMRAEEETCSSARAGSIEHRADEHARVLLEQGDRIDMLEGSARHSAALDQARGLRLDALEKTAHAPQPVVGIEEWEGVRDDLKDLRDGVSRRLAELEERVEKAERPWDALKALEARMLGVAARVDEVEEKLRGEVAGS
jgi:hypothetical protein